MKYNRPTKKFAKAFNGYSVRIFCKNGIEYFAVRDALLYIVLLITCAGVSCTDSVIHFK